ncbi:MAG: DHH family phosphoesterase [Candidatus Latescibacterota bacterium]|nr:DHH family phosphoesterase [Candidatus Latescibacterota bacterium]
MTDKISAKELEKAIQFILREKSFLLTTHTNSDADGIGALMALQNILRQIGKVAHIGLPDPPKGQCDFIPGWENVHHIEETPTKQCSCAIVVDSPTLKRIGDSANYLAGLPILKLDHHKDGHNFGQTNVVSTTVSSTCELVFHMIDAAGWRLDNISAAALYAGILFDTGGFRFSTTTSTTFNVAASLSDYDIGIDQLAENIFGNKDYANVKQIGQAIDSMETHYNGRVAILDLDEIAMRKGEPEGVVNYGLLVKGVLVAILLKATGPNQYRVSLRSREDIDVNKIAQGFSGGGHVRAAGCSLEGSLENIKNQLLTEVGHQLT